MSGIKILMGYRYGDIAPADHLKKALVDMGHTVFTVGPSTDGNVKQDLEVPDRMCEGHAGVYYYDIEKLLKQFGEMDLILMVEPGVYFYNLPISTAPKAFWLIDRILLNDDPVIRELAPGGGGEYIDQIDYIFTAKYNHIPRYLERGITKARHLPLAYNRDAHKQIEAEKVYDIVFLGRTDYLERKHFMDQLRLRYNCFVGTGIIYENYCRKIAQGKVCFNHGHIGELNMRFFELLAMGAFQICNICHAQELMGFHDQVHLINYTNDEELEFILRKYLVDGSAEDLAERRRMISDAGKRKVLEGHSYHDRAREMLQVIFGIENRDAHGNIILH